MKLFATVGGALLLAAGVGVAIVHYVVQSSLAESYITLAIAAVLLVAGWALLDWGAGFSRRRGEDRDKRNL